MKGKGEGDRAEMQSRPKTARNNRLARWVRGIQAKPVDQDIDLGACS
jgi:hypothetical protein